MTREEIEEFIRAALTRQRPRETGGIGAIVAEITDKWMADREDIQDDADQEIDYWREHAVTDSMR